MIFSSEKINNTRQSEIDLAKGLAAILIIICHVGLFLGNPENVGLYTFADIIGSEWGAPVFMALMGMGIIFSKHQEPLDLFKRGVKLFIGGYLLSIIRTVIPYLIFGNIDEWTQFDSYFVVDILQFAGLSFMLLALFKKLNVPSLGTLIISLVMVGIAQYVMTLPKPLVQSKELGYFANLFFPINEWSCFPLFIWFFFPAFGLLFGEFLIRCKDKKKMYSILLPIGLAGVLYVYYQLYKLYPNYTDYYFGKNFYYMGIKNVCLTCFFILFVLSFWFFVDKVLPDFIRKYLTFLGRNLTSFFVLSWVFIGMAIHLLAHFNYQLNPYENVGMMIIQIILCSITTKLIAGKDKQHCHKKRFYMKTQLLGIIIASLTFLYSHPTQAKDRAIWDFDGTIIAGDCSEGLKENGKELYKGLIEEAIMAGFSKQYKGQKGVAQFFADYNDKLENEGKKVAYTYVAKAFERADANALYSLAVKHFKTLKDYYFSDSIDKLNALKEKGVENHVISASLELFVQGAADTLGIPRENIHGIKAEIDSNGKLTGNALEPVPFGDGKVAVMRAIEGNANKALYGFGNSYSTDGPFLIEIAKQGGVSTMINGCHGYSEEKYFNCVNQFEIIKKE